VRLVHLSIASIAGCLLGLVILIGLTLDSVREVRGKQAEVAELLDLQARMDDFSVASDSLLLFGADDGLLAAYRDEARALQARLREVGGDTPGARRAVHRVEEIATTVAREIARRAEAGAGDGPLELPPRSRIIMNQVAGLGGEMDSALDTLLRERQRQIARDAAWIGGGLAGAALLFGALSVIAFILIHRRVAAPARALADTLQAIRGGDLDARAPVRGDDELADLAATLNRMLDERQRMDAELHEHNRRLQQYERLVEHSADRFCILDSEYRYVVTNEAYAALYGRDRASLEGARLEDILEREFLEREALPPIDRCLAGEPQAFEAERSYDSLGTRHFLIRYYPLPEADGSIRQVAAVMTDVTEQRQLDRRLREFNELIEGTEDLCGIADEAYRYLWVNRAYGERYGMAPQDMEGRPLREFLGEAYFDEVVRPRIDRCLAGEPQRFETERIYPNGETRKLLARYYPIEVPGESVRHVGAVITDVTEIRQAETELAEQARLLDVAGRIARFGAWSVELASGAIRWSNITAEIHGMPHGYSPTLEEGIAFYAPECRERIRALFTACVEHGQAYDEELQIINADGERVWVRTVGEPVFDEDGVIVRVQGSFQDISAHKALEREANRLARRLAAMLSAITDGFVAFDEQWRYTYVNAEAERMLGHSGQQLLGTEVWEQFPALVGSPIEEALRGAMEEGISRSVEDWFAPLETWFDVHVYPWQEGVAVFFRDVTESHRMVERLQQQEADLRRSRDALDAALTTRQALINSLPAHIAMLDAEGLIVDVNDQWRHFGQENDYRGGDDFGIGTNYLGLCESASGDCAEEAGMVAEGLREALGGQRQTFALEYPCHSPNKQRWFRVMFNRLAGDGSENIGAVAMHIDITERKRAEQELNRLAYEDPLTGLLSRNGFAHRLGERLSGDGWDRHAAVLMLDVINLRDINDAHGYERGDQLLSELGERLQREIGEDGLAGRTGGDEFVAWIGGHREGQLEQRLDALSASLTGSYLLAGVKVEINLRMGYTALDDRQRNPEELMREAELALFRNREDTALRRPWVAYSPDIDEESHRRIRLTRELREALERDEFELHFQPKVDLRDGGVISAEALLRWHHPERGLQPPGLFIPVAEQSQLIGPIGDWALRDACRQLREWRDAGLEIVRVAVNVSLVQFMVGDFPAKVRAALAEFDVDPQHLSLEITESVFERQSDQLLAEIRALHELGVRLSLDDFGTGYSSLLYLQRYPFDEIKIDQGFVRKLLDDHYSHDIVRTVLGLARALDAEVVAEGIETAAIRDILIELGCTVGQGYYYSVPLEAEDFRWLLEKRNNLPLAAE